uniref:Uncharacterized protein n=1 Tax=Kalanchoe fedtschenkoi TaxID=63787 RepID=A0A7N1A1I1_KALFE
MDMEGGDGIIGWFEKVSSNAGQVQTETLRKILESNWGVDYLRRWLGDADIEKMDDCELELLFTSLVPLASHADFEPFIERIADGDVSPNLTHHPITTLSLSSGTTEGRQKFVPFTNHSSQTTLQIFSLAAAYRTRIYPIREGGRVLEFIYSSKQSKTRGGLSVGTATTHYFASEEFRIKQEKTKSFTCSPREVISSGDYKQSTYCHLLLGLFYYDQVEFVTSTFSYSIVQAYRNLEHLWRELCDDIRTGTVSSRVTLPEMRNAVSEIIRPNPCLAAQIEAMCKYLEEVRWFGVIGKLWPNAKYVYSIMTGSMLHYSTKLRHYAGDLPLISADYGSTESWIGVNVDPGFPPENVTFAVVPTFSYFEFIPLSRQTQQDWSSTAVDDFIEDKPVPLSQVQLGGEYEIVLTTFTGLYRYRLGDVVEVAGFHNNTPKLNFICRRKLILTVNIDKNTEKDLQLVVDKGSKFLAAARANADLIDFTSHADIRHQPGHYIIYWEMDGTVEESVLRQCCSEMDASFSDQGYIVSRKTSSIGPLELRILENGTFKKVVDYFLGNGAAFSQFKTPRCTNNPFILEILNACTISRVYSTAYG